MGLSQSINSNDIKNNIIEHIPTVVQQSIIIFTWNNNINDSEKYKSIHSLIDDMFDMYYKSYSGFSTEFIMGISTCYLVYMRELFENTEYTNKIKGDKLIIFLTNIVESVYNIKI